MTPAETQKLIDEGIAYLKLTTSGYKGHTPTWYANPTTNWALGLGKLAAARKALDVAPAPVPPSVPGAALPVGPFTTLDGLGTQAAGISGATVGQTISGKLIKRFRDYGIVTDGWANGGPVQKTGVLTLRDLIFEDIGRNPPLRLNPAQPLAGTFEHGLFPGVKVDAKRLLFRRCQWAGIVTWGINPGSVYEDITMEEMPYTGIYLEHLSHDQRFTRGKLAMAPGAIAAFLGEWWMKDQPWYQPFSPVPVLSGTYNVTLEDYDIYVPMGCWAVLGGPGTFGWHVRRLKLRGPGNGISLPVASNVLGPPNIVDWDTIDTTELGGQKYREDTNPIGR